MISTTFGPAALAGGGRPISASAHAATIRALMRGQYPARNLTRVSVLTRARALAGFIPDCAVLFRRLMKDRRVPRTRKVLLALMIAYLAMPLDLIPDFIPVAGQLDDALIVALVLRGVVRSAGPELIEQHWPGPASSLAVLLRLAGPDRAS